MDDDIDGGCKRFILVDDEYKLFLDHHLSGDNTVLPPFDDDTEESETRNLSFELSRDSKRSKLTEKKPINKRVSQQRKRETIGSEAEVLRASPLVTTKESIQRDNRASERRKRKMAEFEPARVSRTVPLVNIQGDNKSRKVSESTKVNTLRDVPLVRAIQGDNKARKVSKVNTLRSVPLVRAKETIQRDSKAKKVSQSRKVDTLRDVQETIQRDSKARKVSTNKANTSRDVPLVRAKEVIQGDNKAKKMSESKVDTLQDVPLFRTKEAIRRDNRIAERRKKKTDETKAAGTSRVVHVKRVRRVTEPKTPRFVPVERVNRVTNPKAVDKTPRFVPVTQSNKGISAVGTRKKNVAVVDKDYMSYLTWLVDSLNDATTVVPGPAPSTQKQSEKDHLAKVKVELDTESCSASDDDIIMVSDSPFLSGDSTPFVVSKSKTVIDLEKDSTEDETSTISCLFTKELRDVLKKPYDEGELLRLYGEVSEKKQVTRCRELRKGRESNYETSEFGPSYLDKVPGFDNEYRRVDGDDDKERLKLLRGFFFYLKNVTRPGSFKPWLPENQKKLMD